MPLNKEDVQAMLRLAAEVGEYDAAGPHRCRHVMGALAQMTGAPMSFDISLSRATAAGRFRVHAACIWGLQSGSMVHLGRHITRNVEGVGRAARVEGLMPILKALHPALLKVSHPANQVTTAMISDRLGEIHFVCSVAVRPESLQLFGVCRPPVSAPFTGREALIVELLHTEAERLCHNMSITENTIHVSLPPHLQRIVPELLAGRVEKQIATNLGYTFNTTHQYIKAIYRRVGVSSRAEFMASWMGREPAAELAVHSIAS